MKVQILLLSCLAVVSAAHFRNGVFFSNKHHNGDAANTVIKGAYSTPLDHFSPTNNLSLRLKYEVNVEMFKEGGPLFLYTEFDSKNYWNMNHFGLMYELARKLNGALINAHFRYTGDNFFGDSDLQRELKYLTIDHILADIPYLVSEVKERLNATSSRVIAYGNRVGGAIAVLARKRFPHIIDATWSSSGQFRSAMTDTDSYETTVKQIYLLGGENCTATLSNAYQQLKQLVDDKNVDKLRELFKIPSDEPIDLEDAQHVQYIYRVLFSITSSIENQREAVRAVKDLCQTMTSGSNVLRSFSRWFKSIYGGSDRPFFNYRSWVNETIQQLRWQTTQYFYCTQFGSGRLVTSENGFKNVFPNVVTEQYYDQWCTDIFGVRYNRTLLERASAHFNLQHGGGTQLVSNAIFSEGNMNSQRFSGVTKYNPHTSKFITTQFEGAAKDIFEIYEHDAKEVQAAKKEIVETLSAYIAEK